MGKHKFNQTYSEACLEHSLPSVQNVPGGKCRNPDRMKIDPICGKILHMTDNMDDLSIFHVHFDLYSGDENNSIPGTVRDASESNNSDH